MGTLRSHDRQWFDEVGRESDKAGLDLTQPASRNCHRVSKAAGTSHLVPTPPCQCPCGSNSAANLSTPAHVLRPLSSGLRGKSDHRGAFPAMDPHFSNVTRGRCCHEDHFSPSPCPRRGIFLPERVISKVDPRRTLAEGHMVLKKDGRGACLPLCCGPSWLS